jgi:hypothetical protein
MKPSFSRVAAVLLAAAAVSAPSLHAQAIDDGLMVRKNALFTGFVYGHDRWTDYWEGTLKRDNGNVGSLTTQNVTWMATYGLFDRLNLIATVPYVKTRASGGTLAAQKGIQDLTLAAKYRLFDAGGSHGSVRTFVVASYGTPLSDYVADLFPLSIGMHSRRASGRLTMSYVRNGGLFADATGAYSWRGNVTLDRPSYFTDGQLFLTDQVAMPDVLDYTFRAGYMSPRWMIPVSYSRQDTRGGGDIRRQDMPFVSNNMDFSRLEVMAMYTLPRPANLAVRVAGDRILTGRNVGQSTTFSAGLLYTIHFSK